jgi:mannosyltransferase OCH1-like enzyme
MADVTSGKLPIIQYWHSQRVPAQIASLMATFQVKNPTMPYMSFSEPEAECFIAEHFTTREVMAFRSCAVPAMQADYFRYCAALTLGGVLSDADVHCVCPLEPLVDAVERGVLFRWPTGGINNDFFVFTEPGHPLVRLALDIATVGIERRIAEDVWWVTGPWIFTALAGYRDLGSAQAVRERALAMQLQHSPDLLLEIAGDHTRVVDAFKGVHVEPAVALTEWVHRPELLEHKQGPQDWVRWRERGATIFREP